MKNKKILLSAISAAIVIILAIWIYIDQHSVYKILTTMYRFPTSYSYESAVSYGFLPVDYVHPKPSKRINKFLDDIKNKKTSILKTVGFDGDELVVTLYYHQRYRLMNNGIVGYKYNDYILRSCQYHVKGQYVVLGTYRLTPVLEEHNGIASVYFTYIHGTDMLTRGEIVDLPGRDLLYSYCKSN